MSSTSHIESLSRGIDLLTKPQHGVVVPTSSPDVFRLAKTKPEVRPSTKPLVVLTGPSQAGKDTLMSALLDMGQGALHRVKTATSRDRRDNEAVDAMTWLRKQREDEDFDAYVQSLREGNDLIECTPHSGSVYGLPRINLTDIPEGLVPVLNTDVDGITSLSDNLAVTHSLVSFIVCPDSGSTLVDRITRLGTHVDERIADADRYVARSLEVVNFAVRNPDSASPEETSVRVGREILATLGELGIRIAGS